MRAGGDAVVALDADGALRRFRLAEEIQEARARPRALRSSFGLAAGVEQLPVDQLVRANVRSQDECRVYVWILKFMVACSEDQRSHKKYRLRNTNRFIENGMFEII